MNEIERCDVCDTIAGQLFLVWNDTLGWHGVCRHCKPVPTVTPNGRLEFVQAVTR